MSFIVVKYGDNMEKLLNPNCPCTVLLSHVKKACGYESLVENIDLASENGEVMDLISKPKEYAKKYLEGRGVYLLVKVVGDDTNDEAPTFVPLLEQALGIKFSVSNPSQRHRVKAKAVREQTKTTESESSATNKKGSIFLPTGSKLGKEEETRKKQLDPKKKTLKK